MATPASLQRRLDQMVAALESHEEALLQRPNPPVAAAGAFPSGGLPHAVEAPLEPGEAAPAPQTQLEQLCYQALELRRSLAKHGEVSLESVDRLERDVRRAVGATGVGEPQFAAFPEFDVPSGPDQDPEFTARTPNFGGTELGFLPRPGVSKEQLLAAADSINRWARDQPPSQYFRCCVVDPADVVSQPQLPQEDLQAGGQQRPILLFSDLAPTRKMHVHVLALRDVINSLAQPPELRLEFSAPLAALLGALPAVHSTARLQELLRTHNGDAFAVLHELRGELVRLSQESRNNPGLRELAYDLGARLSLFIGQVTAPEGAQAIPNLQQACERAIKDGIVSARLASRLDVFGLIANLIDTLQPEIIQSFWGPAQTAVFLRSLATFLEGDPRWCAALFGRILEQWMVAPKPDFDPGKHPQVLRFVRRVCSELVFVRTGYSEGAVFETNLRGICDVDLLMLPNDPMYEHLAKPLQQELSAVAFAPPAEGGSFQDMLETVDGHLRGLRQRQAELFRIAPSTDGPQAPSECAVRISSAGWAQEAMSNPRAANMRQAITQTCFPDSPEIAECVLAFLPQQTGITVENLAQPKELPHGKSLQVEISFEARPGAKRFDRVRALGQLKPILQMVQQAVPGLSFEMVHEADSSSLVLSWDGQVPLPDLEKPEALLRLCRWAFLGFRVRSVSAHPPTDYFHISESPAEPSREEVAAENKAGEPGAPDEEKRPDLDESLQRLADTPERLLGQTSIAVQMSALDTPLSPQEIAQRYQALGVTLKDATVGLPFVRAALRSIGSTPLDIELDLERLAQRCNEVPLGEADPHRDLAGGTSLHPQLGLLLISLEAMLKKYDAAQPRFEGEAPAQRPVQLQPLLDSYRSELLRVYHLRAAGQSQRAQRSLEAVVQHQRELAGLVVLRWLPLHLALQQDLPVEVFQEITAAMGALERPQDNPGLILKSVVDLIPIVADILVLPPGCAESDQRPIPAAIVTEEMDRIKALLERAGVLHYLDTLHYNTRLRSRLWRRLQYLVWTQAGLCSRAEQQKVLSEVARILLGQATPRERRRLLDALQDSFEGYLRRLRALHVLEGACAAVLEGQGQVSAATLNLARIDEHAPYIGSLEDPMMAPAATFLAVTRALRQSFAQVDRVVIRADPRCLLGLGRELGGEPEAHLGPVGIAVYLEGLLRTDYLPEEAWVLRLAWASVLDRRKQLRMPPIINEFATRLLPQSVAKRLACTRLMPGQTPNGRADVTVRLEGPQEFRFNLQVPGPQAYLADVVKDTDWAQLIPLPEDGSVDAVVCLGNTELVHLSRHDVAGEKAAAIKVQLLPAGYHTLALKEDNSLRLNYQLRRVRAANASDPVNVAADASEEAKDGAGAAKDDEDAADAVVSAEAEEKQEVPKPVREGSLVLPDGAKYTGGLDAQDRPCGQGKMEFINGRVYTGSFLGGKRHGFGVMESRDGSFYKGWWAAGLEDGLGVSLGPEDDSETTWAMWEKGELVQQIPEDAFPEIGWGYMLSGLDGEETWIELTQQIKANLESKRAQQEANDPKAAEGSACVIQ